jgi:hypothetical protein
MRVAVSIVAMLALAGCFWMARDVAGAYLSAFLFCLGLGLGSVALLLIHSLTGGAWGLQLRPSLLAAAQILPVLAALLIPLLAGTPRFFPWVGAVHGPSWYLNVPFFIGRSVVSFLAWLWMLYVVSRPVQSSPGGAALALIVYLITTTAMAVDWVMSLVPGWHSSVFGLIFGTTQVLTAAALAIATLNTRSTVGPDLGRLLLTLVLVWGYLVFMDYLTAWSADLPDEVEWYWPRLRTHWDYLTVWIVVAGLVVPLAALLSGWVKRRYDVLRTVCLLILVTQATYIIWLVLPSLHADGWSLTWSDLLPWIGVGGLCWARFNAVHERLARAAP